MSAPTASQRSHPRRPEVVTAFLAAVIGGVSDGAVLTSAARTWTQELTSDGVHVQWDAVNKRPFAVTGGIFRVNAGAYIDGKSTGAVAYIASGFDLVKNGAAIIGQATDDNYGVPTGSESTSTHAIDRTVELLAGDFITMVGHVSVSPGVGTMDVNPASRGTFIELHYLGPV